MEGERLGDKYAYLFKDLAAFARAENKIDEPNIYQEANQKILLPNLISLKKTKELNCLRIYIQPMTVTAFYKY